MVEINDLNYSEFVKSNDVVVLKYYGTWCGPCKTLNPMMNDLSKEYVNINFGSVDIDQNRNLSMNYNVRSIPTILFFKDGEVVDRITGAQPKTVMVEKLNNLINN